MKKNKLWFLLALLICMAVLCTAAAAADGEESTGVTALWLGSKDLKDGGYWEIGFPDLSGSSEVTSVSSDDSWNVHYDPAENTLTLRDADFTGSCMDADGLSASQSTAALFVDGDLSINIIGTNSIASNYFYGDYSYGSYIDGGNISISGQDGARLTFAGENASSSRGVYATSTSNLTMESGTLSCVGGVGGSSRGMNWYGNITLQGTSRLVSNKGDGYGSTVYVSGLLTIENSARMDCKGIITDYGEIHIKDNGVKFTDLTAGTAYYFFARTAGNDNYEAATSEACEIKTLEKAVESISLSGEYKTAYTAGEKLDLSGLTVTVTYNDGTSSEITTGFTTDPGADEPLTTADTIVTVTYGGKDAEFAITVTEPDEPGTDPDPDPDEPGTDLDPDPDEPGTDPDWPDWPDRPDRPNYPDDEPVYAPEVDVSGGGSVDVSPSRPEEGDTVIITPEPDNGYATGDVSVTDADGDEVDVDRRPDGSYSFVQPKGEVEISVSFVPARLPFADVSAGSWYYDAVEFVWSNGIMDGVGSGLFAPNQVLTRDMLVTVLWRIDGAPDVSAALPFDDVADGSWYTDAVRWAASNGIVDGTGETSFSPDDKITREQLAVILWRYAGYKSCDTTGGVDLTDFADRGSVSAYALRAMRWAVAERLVTGVADDTIAPLAGTTRAEAAAVLQRFSENILTLQSA